MLNAYKSDYPAITRVSLNSSAFHVVVVVAGGEGVPRGLNNRRKQPTGRSFRPGSDDSGKFQHPGCNTPDLTLPADLFSAVKFAWAQEASC